MDAPDQLLAHGRMASATSMIELFLDREALVGIDISTRSRPCWLAIVLRTSPGRASDQVSTEKSLVFMGESSAERTKREHSGPIIVLIL